MCCTWFAHHCTRATWAYVLEMVRVAVRRLSKILNCAFECDYYYYYYYYCCCPSARIQGDHCMGESSVHVLSQLGGSHAPSSEKVLAMHISVTGIHPFKKGQQGTPTAYTLTVVWQAPSVVSRLVAGGTSCCCCGAFRFSTEWTRLTWAAGWSPTGGVPLAGWS